VESIEVRSDFSVKLKCYSFDFNVLAWNIDDDVAYTVAPVFDFIISPPSSVAFSEGTTDVLGFSSGQLSWQHADDVSATDYLVEISADNGSTYQSLGVTRANTFDIVGLQTGVYTFSVRSRTPSGTLSERVLNTGNTIQLKTVGSVAIVYADTSDETSNTQSYTAGSNTFVAYYAHNGETPILPITTEIEFKLFIGENGNQTKTVYLFSNGVNPPSAPAGNDGYNISTGSAEASSPWTLNSTSPSPDQTIYQASALLTQLNGVGNWAALAGWEVNPLATSGSSGDAGQRGAGWWRYETGDNSSVSGLSNATLNGYFASATSLTTTAADRFIVVNSGNDAIGYLRNNTNSSWIQQTDFLDGDLLVSGTITSDKLSVNSLDAITSDVGTMTAGILQSSDGNFVINLNNKTITIIT